MEESRWGIIYCPRRSMRRIQKEWDAMREYMSEKGVLFDFVQSEGLNSVERLAAMLTSNGYKTIVVVGGDSALNRALNGILSVDEERRKGVALGVIPNSNVNDFARFWGFEPKHYKKTIDSLIRHRVRKVDVGVCASSDTNDNVRYFINCVNVGLVASIMTLKRKTKRIFGLRMLSYLSSVFLLIFHRMEHKMRLNVNQTEINQDVTSICIGSAKGYGQTPSAVPYNGLLDVSIVSHSELTQIFEALWMLSRGSFLNHKAVKSYRTQKVNIYEIGTAKVTVDGVLWKEVKAPLNISIRQEFIDFIIP